MSRNIERDVSEDAYKPAWAHGYPVDQWKDLKERKTSLSRQIPFREWTEITHGKVPDLNLGQYLAARFVVYSLPIPPRIKDFVVINSPEWIRTSLNNWNRDTGHFKRDFAFGDIRTIDPLAAIAASCSHLYLPYEKESIQLEELALALFNMSCDLELLEVTENMSTSNGALIVPPLP